MQSPNNGPLGLFAPVPHSINPVAHSRNTVDSDSKECELIKLNVHTVSGPQPITDPQFLPLFMQQGLPKPQDEIDLTDMIQISAVDRIDEAFQDFIAYPTPENKDLFLKILQTHEPVKEALNYLIRPQREKDYVSVPLNASGNETFSLYGYRPAPLYLLVDQMNRLGFVDLVESISSFFNGKGMPVAYPDNIDSDNKNDLNLSGGSNRLGWPSITSRKHKRVKNSNDKNLLINTAGIYKDRQANTYIGHFDNRGLLKGPGMVINDAKRSVLTGAFKSGALEGKGFYIDDKIRFYCNYSGGRANGNGLVSSLLGQSGCYGPVASGQMQNYRRFEQKSSQETPDSKNLDNGKTKEPDVAPLLYELPDFVDGTIDLTAQAIETKQMNAYKSRSDRRRSVEENPLDLPFLKSKYNHYKKLTMKNGVWSSRYKVLSLPDGSFMGTKQVGRAIVTEWTYRNGELKDEPLQAPSLASNHIKHAVTELQNDGKSKSSGKTFKPSGK